MKKQYPYSEGMDEYLNVIPCGTRRMAYKHFSNALERRNRGEDKEKGEVLLLVDSEDPIKTVNPWEHLKGREGDQWERPNGATDEHAHLMVHCMENWFLADPQALRAYFGQDFNNSALSTTHTVEDVLKSVVLQELEKASSGTTKGKYGKGKHSFDIFEKMDPIKVQDRAPWFCRLLKTLDNIMIHKRHNKSTRQCKTPC
ncbi:MAG TPA: DUF4276 family protein [Magnetococcales bacterium]|nr:DUF4276 family protein [Magnetococcales bacterium]